MTRLIVISLFACLAYTGCCCTVPTPADNSPTPGSSSTGGDEAELSEEAYSRLETIDARFNAGDFEYAEREGQRFVDEHPDSFQGWLLMGWVYSKTDRLDQAQECFEKSIALNPKSDNAYVGIGVIHRKRGDPDAARTAYLKAIEMLPDNAEAYSSLMVIELQAGNDNKAVEYGEKAWGMRNDLAIIPANLAIAYHYQGDFAKRDQFYEHAKRLNYPNMQALDDIFSGITTIR